MKKIIFSVIPTLLFLFTACEKKGDDSIQRGQNTTDSTGLQEVAEDTLDEFEYEADSVETDDDEDI
jgi:hypothetical protein